MYRVVSFCFMFLASLSANAQSSSTNVASTAASSVSATMPKDPNAEKPFSLSVTLSTSTNLEEESSAADSSGSTIEINPSVRISSKASVSALVSVEADHNTDESKLLNTNLTLSRDPIKLTDDLSLKLSAVAVLPTDREAREEATLRGAGGITVGLQRNFAIKGKESTISYSANVLKNAHEFTRNNMRESNLSHRLRNTLSLEVTLSKKVSVGASGYYQIGQTYEGVVRETFTAAQSVSYSLDDNFSISLEHSTGGKVFAADGAEWDAKLYDSRKSEIGVSISGTY